MKIKNLTLTLCTTLLLATFAGHAKEVKIGMAIDDLRLERWQKIAISLLKKRNLSARRCSFSPLTATKRRKCRKLRI